MRLVVVSALPAKAGCSRTEPAVVRPFLVVLAALGGAVYVLANELLFVVAAGDGGGRRWIGASLATSTQWWLLAAPFGWFLALSHMHVQRPNVHVR